MIRSIDKRCFVVMSVEVVEEFLYFLNTTVNYVDVILVLPVKSTSIENKLVMIEIMLYASS